MFPRRVDHGDMREQLPYGRVLGAGYVELRDGAFRCHADMPNWILWPVPRMRPFDEAFQKPSRACRWPDRASRNFPDKAFPLANEWMRPVSALGDPMPELPEVETIARTSLRKSRGGALWLASCSTFHF